MNVPPSELMTARSQIAGRLKEKEPRMELKRLEVVAMIAVAAKNKAKVLMRFL